MKSNLLKHKTFRENVEKELNDLTKEGWLSAEELKSLTSRLDEVGR